MSAYRGIMLMPPLETPDFALTDTSGSPFVFAEEAKGAVTMVYFGYTYCANPCRTQMADLVTEVNSLPEDAGQPVNIVFVTIDPRRDTPERLREWLDRFDPSIAGVAGDSETIDAAMKEALGSLWRPINSENADDGDHAIEHPGFVLAYTPDGTAHLAYPLDETEREDWERDLPKLVREKTWGCQ